VFEIVYPAWFIFCLAILLGYLSVVDWLYLSISYLDLGIVILFTIFFSSTFFLHHYLFFSEQFSLKFLILFLIIVGYLLLIYFKKMGSGDFWVFILISLLLTPQTILKSLHISIISGGVYSLILVIIDRKNRKKQIPFIPFITIGFLVAILFNIL
jgi:prepilin signal peptidase PulO-like enzyme (type II secretory pathway)